MSPRRPRLLIVLSFVAIVLAALTMAHAGDAGVAESSSTSLFFIERSKNANIVQYDANLAADGSCNSRNPVAAYWVMHAENGRREALTRLERELAYGFTTRLDATGTTVWMVLVAHRARPIKIVCGNGTARAEIQNAGRRGYLTKLYVQETSGVVPGVEWIRLSANATSEGMVLSRWWRPCDPRGASRGTRRRARSRPDRARCGALSARSLR